MRELSFYKLFYLFIFGCVFGWTIEVIPNLLIDGVFYNHSSLVIGPFNLVYGLGAVLATILLYQFKNRSSLIIFISSAIFGTIFEYLMSLTMELLVGFTAWNYSHLPFNIDGRVSIRFTLFWGLLGIVWFKHLYPYLLDVINKFNKNIALKKSKTENNIQNIVKNELIYQKMKKLFKKYKKMLYKKTSHFLNVGFVYTLKKMFLKEHFLN